MTTPTVEVKFAGSSWTDITGYLRQVAVRRGRSNDLAVVDPGTLDIELDNNDGRFTPQNSQGTYYPNVKPGVAVRVTMNAGAGPSDFRLFTGKAQRWEPRWDVGGRPVVILEAVDGFEELANYELRYAHHEVVIHNGADGYWPCDDTGSEATDWSGNARHLQVETASGSAQGESSLVTGGDGAWTQILATRYDPSIPDSWYGAANDLTVSLWVQPSSTSPDGTLIAVSDAPFRGGSSSPPVDATNVGWGLGLSAGNVRWSFADGTTRETVATSLSWTVGQTYHLAVHWDQSASEVSFYRDGSLVATESVSLSPGVPGTNRTITVGPSFPSPALTLCDVAFWASDQSSVVSDLEESGDGGYASDLPGARIGRVLDWAGWDASARDLDTGTTPLAAVSSGSALSACQDAASADGGVFFMSSGGDATFQGRRERWEDPAALDYTDAYTDTYGGTAVDFDDDGTDTGYQAVGWRYDTTLLSNRVVVNSNTQGTSDGFAEDTTAQTAYGIRSLSISTISNNTDDNAERAQWELSRRKDPHLRLEEIAFLVADTVQEDAAGSLELQSLVTVSRRPGSGQDDLVVQMRVASIEHSLSDGGSTWRARFGLLEADTDQPGVWDQFVWGEAVWGY